MRRRESGRAGQKKPQGYHAGIGQRFGHYEPGLAAKMHGAIWLHSISVGETFVALKLARELRARGADKVLISVTTATGFEIVCEAAFRESWLVAIYNPVDLRFVVKRALSAIAPRKVVFIEGELWPNLLDLCNRNEIPVFLANARMSPRSERRFKRFAWAAGWLWRMPQAVSVQDEGDLARFVSVGVPPELLVMTGNIKYDNALADSASREAGFRDFVSALGFHSHNPIIVAGSTWDPEEKALADAFVKLRVEFPDLKLIVVPRHVERTAEIINGLAGLRVAKRSGFPEPADVLLVDVTGELRDWYRLATVVFVGKSLPGVSQTGGQNAGEPAALGKAVIFGPHMENFEALTRHLLEKSAAISVQNANELVPVIRRLLLDAAEREAIGARARSVLVPHQAATARTADMLG